MVSRSDIFKPLGDYTKVMEEEVALLLGKGSWQIKVRTYAPISRTYPAVLQPAVHALMTPCLSRLPWLLLLLACPFDTYTAVPAWPF